MDGDASFGGWLRQRRKQLDLTQARLAAQVGCAAETLRKIESGRLRPSREIASRLAECLDVPAAERDAFVQAARGSATPTLPRAAEPIRTRLPAPLTSLIGREDELAELRTLLANPACRLITIVGPGGIGKTRLVLAIAAEQAALFPDGAALVPLAAVSTPALVAPAILAALDVPLQGQRDPREQLIEMLRDKGLLLVLDNFEQLLCAEGDSGDVTIALLRDVLHAAPSVQLLVTSRERLRMQGEWLFDLGGLCYPLDEAGVGLTETAAMQLFVERARQVRPHPALTNDELRAAGRMCNRALRLRTHSRRALQPSPLICERFRSGTTASGRRSSTPGDYSASASAMCSRGCRCFAAGSISRLLLTSRRQTRCCSRHSSINRCCAGTAWGATICTS
jgi:transcriptional regulator with XRE-family HTH domain